MKRPGIAKQLRTFLHKHQGKCYFAYEIEEATGIPAEKVAPNLRARKQLGYVMRIKKHNPRSTAYNKVRTAYRATTDLEKERLIPKRIEQEKFVYEGCGAEMKEKIYCPEIDKEIKKLECCGNPERKGCKKCYWLGKLDQGWKNNHYEMVAVDRTIYDLT